MELIRPDTKIDFIGYSRWAIGFSCLLILAGVVSLVIHNGPNYGIDFSGGTMMQVRFSHNLPIREIRSTLSPLGFGDAPIQDFGSSSTAGGEEFLIRLPLDASKTSVSKQVAASMERKFGKDAFEVQRVEMVGPKVGKDLRRRAILAVAFATLMMGAYIWFRFELRFGIGAAVALLHDVFISVGALSLFAYEVDLTVVAALLTVVGFSVNDTVIVSDRIRENMRKHPRDPLAAIINSSINETLSRTILTTGTALLVILALFVLGGNVIHGFAFTLLVGFSVGTYSSIYVSSPIVLYLERGSRRRRR
ncbi:MAG: protein translocase subunit SecF [Candidatus Binatia bacterium]